MVMNLEGFPLGPDPRLTRKPSSDNNGIVGCRVYRSVDPYFDVKSRNLITTPLDKECVDGVILGNADADHHYPILYDTDDND